MNGWNKDSDDLISRREAINALGNAGLINYAATGSSNGLIHAMNVIKGLPSAQPQRIRGRWIDDAKTYYERLIKKGLGVDEYTPYFTDDIACSECLAKYSVIDNETQFFKFCPNCGADMREGEQDDS